MTFFVPLLLSAAAAGAAPPLPLVSRAPVAAVGSTSSLPPTVDLSLSEALDMLRNGNARTEADKAPIEAARADLVAAAVAPNPTIAYEGTRLHSGTNTGAADVDTLTAEWPVLLFGQRKARKDAAGSAVAASEAHVAADFAERARDLRKAYDTLRIQQERVEVLTEAREDLTRIAGIVAARRSAGDASDYDALRVETESREMGAQLGDSEGDLSEAQGRVASMLARPALIPRATRDVKPAAIEPLDAEALWPEAESKLPELEAARRDGAAARAGEHAARRDRWPAPALTGGVESTRDASSKSWVFGLSFPIPILDRNQGALAHAQAAADEADLRRKALEAELRAELDAAVRVAVRRRAAVAGLETGVASKVPQMRSMAETAYREGRGGILELLDALRSLTATRLARLDALQSMAEADADLLFLLGRADQDAAPGS